MPPKTLDIDPRFFIRASPSKVFRALTDPRWLTRWFSASTIIQPKAGTPYTFRWLGGHSHTGQVLAAVPNRRLSLSWPNRVGRDTHLTRVTFNLARKGNGTMFHLRHVGYPAALRWRTTYGNTKSGWAYFLLNL